MMLICSKLIAATPPIAEVHRHVILSAGLANQDIEKWKKRIPLRALLPQLRVSVQRDVDENFRITNSDKVSISGGNVTIGPDEQDFIHDFDAGTRFQVAAVWYLDRLLFSRDSIVVSQERRRRKEEELKLLDRVTQLYFERVEALNLLRMKKRWPRQDKLKLQIVVRDRTARLDAYTGGWFGHAIHGKDETHETH
jgi:hypothetical protein